MRNEIFRQIIYLKPARIVATIRLCIERLSSPFFYFEEHVYVRGIYIVM